jgi:hypothetical protein
MFARYSRCRRAGLRRQGREKHPLNEDLWRLREAQHDESSVNRKPSNTRLRATYRDVDGGHVKAHSRRRVDVIVTHGAATRSFVKGHRTIPAVYEFSADPVTLGIAAVPPWALRTFPTEHF